MYTSDRPSPVHSARKWTVSPKVTRENGPEGSCLTQMSAATRPARQPRDAYDRALSSALTRPTSPSGVNGFWMNGASVSSSPHARISEPG